MLYLCCPRCPWAVLAAGSGGTHHALSTPGHRSSSSEQLQPCASLSRAGLCWAEPWEGTGSWWVPGVGAGPHSCLCALLTWVTAAGWLWAAVRPCRLSEHPTSPPNPPRCGMGAQAEAESLCWSSGAGLCLHPSGAAPSTAGAWAVPEHPQGTDLLQVPLWGSARP